MTLPSSGTLDFNSIRAEFGGPSSNVTMSTYNRGGTYTYAVPANANIPTGTTDTIEVSDFYGAKNTTDYLGNVGGSHNSGGKAPLQYYGNSNSLIGPLPSLSDQSMKVGSQSFTAVTEFYMQSAGASGGGGSFDFYVHFDSGAGASVYGNTSIWPSRQVKIYNGSGTIQTTVTMSNCAGFEANFLIPAGSTGLTAPTTNGIYRLTSDNARNAFGANPAAPSPLQPAAASPSTSDGAFLNGQYYVQAF
jgi:hypothetical protein|tara:strand:+ start:722 stop:1462 length:741 start_codon:yes stop_codon:yes gene_type:complete